jgi:hypothetical protein
MKDHCYNYLAKESGNTSLKHTLHKIKIYPKQSPTLLIRLFLPLLPPAQPPISYHMTQLHDTPTQHQQHPPNCSLQLPPSIITTSRAHHTERKSYKTRIIHKAENRTFNNHLIQHRNYSNLRTIESRTSVHPQKKTFVRKRRYNLGISTIHLAI